MYMCVCVCVYLYIYIYIHIVIPTVEHALKMPSYVDKHHKTTGSLKINVKP